jgi:hypothetical protein
MFFGAFLPLICYIFGLTFLHIRRRPTIINGGWDFMLLSCGLFGLITLGPGRLLIPMNVLTFWGSTVWLFWTAFYFAVAHLIAHQLPKRIIVYGSSFNVFVPKLIELAKEIDSQVRFEGNVLFLPDAGIQCSIHGGFFYLILTATEPHLAESKWQLLEQILQTKYCKNDSKTS